MSQTADKRGTNGVPRHSVKGTSNKFRRMSELYRIFARGYSDLDFSDDALLSLYNHESYGLALSPRNGFAVGKQYLNVQVAMWRDDIRSGIIAKFELYEDERFPHAWLDSVLGNIWDGYTYEDIIKTSKIG